MNLKLPEVLEEAKRSGKGLPWIVEMLIFIGVFLVASIVQSIFMLPGMVVAMFTKPELMDSIMEYMMQGDVFQVEVLVAQIMSSDIITLSMLFANAGIILIVCLFCKLIQKRKMTTLGFVKKNMFKEYGKGCLLGFVLFSVAVLICVVTGSLKLQISSTFSISLFVLFVLGFMIQGMAEEVMCRGYLLVSIARRSSVIVAIICNAVVFAVLHLSNAGISVLAVVNLILFAVFASLYFIKTGNIWGVGALHSIWNLVQGNVYGICVSGISVSSSVLEADVVTKGTLWNGGNFGLEGGLAVTIVLLAGCAMLLLWKKKEESERNFS